MNNKIYFKNQSENDHPALKYNWQFWEKSATLLKKSAKRQYCQSSVKELRSCLETADWEIFQNANNLHEYVETVTSYIHFCEDGIFPTGNQGSYVHDKPWFTAQLRQIRWEKEVAFNSGDTNSYKEIKYGFSREVTKAKLSNSNTPRAVHYQRLCSNCVERAKGDHKLLA